MREVNIQVEVAGSVYPLKVNAEDEKSIKEAVDLINRKIAEFEKNYAIKDKKDVLGMVLLQLVAELHKRNNDTEKELSHLKMLFADVELMLKQHKRDIDTITEE
jgi:cell division protein ZapA (FtsZ GTPase activity inhibitor)